MERLVRDKIPEIMEKQGKKAHFRQAGNDEKEELVKKKFFEEIEEYFYSKEKEELADILELVHAVAEKEGIDFSELERLRAEKTRERGSFKKWLVLEE